MDKQRMTQEEFKQGVTLIDISTYQRQYDVKKHEIFTNKHKFPDPEIVIPLTDEVGNPLIVRKNHDLKSVLVPLIV